MNTLTDVKHNQSNDALTTIERIAELPGIGDIITISGYVGTIDGSFNDPTDGLLTGDSYELHSFTSYILLTIGPADLEAGINVYREGQDV